MSALGATFSPAGYGRLGEVANVGFGAFKFKKPRLGWSAALEKAGWPEWARSCLRGTAASENRNLDDRFPAMNPRRGRSLGWSRQWQKLEAAVLWLAPKFKSSL